MHKLLPIVALLLFLACRNNPPSGTGSTPQINLDSLRSEGRLIAKASFEALSGELTKAMQSGGVRQALDYCHANALPLTDSLSAAHGARIRRVAVRNRNPQNLPDATERALLQAFEAQQAQGRDLKTADTVLLLAPGRVLFAKPILLQPQCLACHGTVGETVLEADYAEIKKRYPDDRAVGFKTGDLRGMWAVYFER